VVLTPELLLLVAAGGVGVLHTVGPDHWVPIALIARQQRWTRAQTARRALIAGFGHVASTLVLGLGLWLAGVAFADRLGHVVSYVSSAALVAFGGWVALGALRELGANHESVQSELLEERRKRSLRTSLLLILGSSPMVEGIPLFLAAAKYGVALLALMASLLGVATMATYVVLCVSSAAGLRRMRFGALERYGEVFSGALIALIGAAFLFWPAI